MKTIRVSLSTPGHPISVQKRRVGSYKSGADQYRAVCGCGWEAQYWRPITLVRAQWADALEDGREHLDGNP